MPFCFLGSVCKNFTLFMVFHIHRFQYVRCLLVGVCSSLALMNPSTLWLNNFDSSVSNSSICGLINFIMDSSILWAKKLVPLWILISSCDEFVHLWTFTLLIQTCLLMGLIMDPSTCGLNHESVYFIKLVNFMGWTCQIYWLSYEPFFLWTCPP